MSCNTEQLEQASIVPYHDSKPQHPWQIAPLQCDVRILGHHFETPIVRPVATAAHAIRTLPKTIPSTPTTVLIASATETIP